MPTPSTTVWELDEHSRGKHIVLERYLKAWLPILGTTQSRIVFIDGFAGPGEYTGGEKGSPLIALKALVEHTAPITASVHFLFIEADPRRSHHLQTLVAPYAEALAGRATIEVRTGTFDSELSGLLNEIEAKKMLLAPSFVMADPFGVSHTPMSVMKQILRNPSSEVYVSFMAEFINRFKNTDEFEGPLDGLFGCPEWRAAREIHSFHDRKVFLFELYARQLKASGAKYVVHFELYRGGELVYAIFFATGNLGGCDKMKEAIWTADPEGGSCFVSGQDAAMNLFTRDVSRLEQELYAGLLKTRAWVPIERLIAWSRSDKTHYYSGQLKTALRSLEKAGKIEVKDGSRKRRGTFPDRTLLRGVPPL